MVAGRWVLMLVGILGVIWTGLSPWGLASARIVGQPATPAACGPLPRPPAPALADIAPAGEPPAPPAGAIPMRVGFIPISIYAPVFVALDLGYYAEEGLAVSLEPLPGGADLVALTASGQLEAATAGAGPAFWNAIALDLPLVVVAPGHFENSPVATPLMIARSVCETGAISSVADLRGKRVSVNARGATEYWLAQALATGGLTLEDVDLQTIPFPDAVVALQSGAIEAAMVGEPLASKAEQDGIAVRLAADFPVQDVMPTALMANEEWAAANPEATVGFVRAYLRAAADLQNGGFADPRILAIIEKYTGIPAELVAASVPPRYDPNGKVDPESLAKLQHFFRERGQLEYETDIDPATVIDPSFADRARAADAAAGS